MRMLPVPPSPNACFPFRGRCCRGSTAAAAVVATTCRTKIRRKVTFAGAAAGTGTGTAGTAALGRRPRWKNNNNDDVVVAGFGSNGRSVSRRSAVHIPESQQQPFRSLLEPLSSVLGISQQQQRQNDSRVNNWRIHDDLKPHARSCLSLYGAVGGGAAAAAAAAASSDNDRKTNKTLYQRNTGFSACFLGTGSGAPTIERGNAATVLRLEERGALYLFDAGEGLQRQLQLSTLSVGDIRCVFITHLHGDHVFGLPGLLLSMQHVAVVKKKHSSSSKKNNNNMTVRIYGPEGLYNFIASAVSLSQVELKHLTVIVYELTGGSDGWRHPAASREYREFQHAGLIRKRIRRNDDTATWTLQTATEITSPELASELVQPRGVYVAAAEVVHVPKLQCFGYAVREPASQPAKINQDAAVAAGVRPGNKYTLLKCGYPVPADHSDSVTVHPDTVCIPDSARSPRKFALLGDCRSVPQPMLELCRDADILVHEATLCSSSSGSAASSGGGSAAGSYSKVAFGGHSTAAQAGAVAAAANAKVLVLNHLSATTQFRSVESGLIQQAEHAVKQQQQQQQQEREQEQEQGGTGTVATATTTTTTRVQVAYDFLELLVPHSGFSFSCNDK